MEESDGERTFVEDMEAHLGLQINAQINYKPDHIPLIYVCLSNQEQNITQLMSYVHGPNNKIEIEDSKCWNPTASY